MITPVNGYVVVERFKQEKNSLIYIPDENETLYNGVVLAESTGRIEGMNEYEDSIVSIGDKILFPRTKALVHGEYYLIKQQDIIGLLEE